MTTPLHSPPPAAAASFWLVVRTVLLLGILSVEVLAFSLCFDVQPLQQSDVLLARVAGHGTTIFRVLAAALVALLVIGLRQLPDMIRRWTELASRDRTVGWACAGHVLAVSGFALFSSIVLQPNRPQTSPWEIWLWALTGGLSLATWLAALAPVRFWFEWWRAKNALLIAASLSIGVAVNFVSLYTRELWIPLSDLTLVVCERLLALVSDDVVCDPARRVLGAGGFRVQIAPECSGYEGIGLVVAAFALLVILFRQELRFPQALVLLPIGIVAIWLSNAVRIVALILIGAHGWPEVAVNGFHSQAGWILFVAITLAMSALALRSPWFAKHNPPLAEAGAPVAPSNSSAYLMPLLAMIAAAMVTGLVSAGFEWLYPIHVAAGMVALWYYRTAYRGITWSWSWVAVANGLVVFALWMALEPRSTSSGSLLAEGLDKLPRVWAVVWLAFRVLGSVFVAPAAEELAFRGYLMRRFTGRDFEAVSYHRVSWLAVAVSSLLFGLLHGHRLAAGTLAGVAYALAARRRDRLSDAIVAHAVTNGSIAVYALWTHSWYIWE